MFKKRNEGGSETFTKSKNMPNVSSKSYYLLGFPLMLLLLLFLAFSSFHNNESPPQQFFSSFTQSSLDHTNASQTSTSSSYSSAMKNSIKVRISLKIHMYRVSIAIVKKSKRYDESFNSSN